VLNVLYQNDTSPFLFIMPQKIKTKNQCQIDIGFVLHLIKESYS